jgi:hypothetical protein
MSTATLPANANSTAGSDPFELTATAGASTFDLCPAGNHPAILIGLIDAGTHPIEFKDGTKDLRQVILVWELPAEIRPNGEPFILAKQYTHSFAESANLRKMVQGWRGRNFEEGEHFTLVTLMDKPCLISVVHKKGSKDRTFHEINGVGCVPKGMVVPQRHHETFIYTVNGTDEPPTFDWLPYIYGQSIADIVNNSREVKARTAASSAKADDDIPF